MFLCMAQRVTTTDPSWFTGARLIPFFELYHTEQFIVGTHVLWVRSPRDAVQERDV
jgi:hypothetical protein